MTSRWLRGMKSPARSGAYAKTRVFVYARAAPVLSVVCGNKRPRARVWAAEVCHPSLARKRARPGKDKASGRFWNRYSSPHCESTSSRQAHPERRAGAVRAGAGFARTRAPARPRGIRAVTQLCGRSAAGRGGARRGGTDSPDKARGCSASRGSSAIAVFVCAATSESMPGLSRPFPPTHQSQDGDAGHLAGPGAPSAGTSS